MTAPTRVATLLGSFGWPQSHHVGVGIAYEPSLTLGVAASQPIESGVVVVVVVLVVAMSHPPTPMGWLASHTNTHGVAASHLFRGFRVATKPPAHG